MKYRTAFRRTVTGALVLASLLAAGCASTPELTSSWNDHQVVIDGQATEWTSNVNYLNDAHVSLGIKNDADNVYVLLMSSEQQFRRQLMGLGLTVWFEREDGGKIGIHYPMGVVNSRGAERPDDEGDNPDSPDRREPRLAGGLDNLEILGSDDKDRREFSTVEATGISVKVGKAVGSTVYELKIPLKESNDHPYAVGVAPGGFVKLGLETGKFEGRRNEGGGMRMGRRGGRMGGYGEQPEGARGEGRAERPEPLDFWAKVHLSTTAAGTSSLR